MDLSRALLRLAAGRPHVLVISTPGADRLRARMEQEVGRRGWPTALSPADADVLAVVGTPGPELAEIIEHVWSGVPAPRTRLRVAAADDVSIALDDAVVALADLGGQRAQDLGVPATEHRHAGDAVGPAEAGAVDVAHSDHPGPPSPAPEPGHDEQHHHHGGGAPLAGGLEMADLGEDRDGLALDRLHVALGPVLPEWPSGLVVDVTLQGDVIQEARSRFLDPGGHDEESVPDVVRALTSVARVLALAGWEGPAGRARTVRDAVLFDEERAAGRMRGELEALHRFVRRSRLLRWMLRSSGRDRIEVLAALDDKLSSVRAALSGATSEPTADVDLPTLDARLVGAEFGAARLIVATANLRPRSALASSAERQETS